MVRLHRVRGVAKSTNMASLDKPSAARARNIRSRRTGNDKQPKPAATATPIPRTLAMTMYGDLDVSVIDEMPPGRKPIVTKHSTSDRIEQVYSFMKAQIEEGRQAYVVYPVIEESETQAMK